MSGDVTVVPAPGEAAATARLLLELAGDVPEIVRTARGGTEFLVPASLAEAYEKSVAGDPEPAPKRSTRRTRGKE